MPWHLAWGGRASAGTEKDKRVRSEAPSERKILLLRK